MSTFKQFEPKRSLTWTPAAPTSSLLQPSRSFTPLPAPASEPAPLITQARLDYAARLGHSFDQISIFPSRPAPRAPTFTLGQPADKYEREADRVAQQVINALHPSHSASASNQHPVIQQMGSLHGEQEGQAKPGAEDGGPVTDDFGTSIQQARSSGQPLSGEIRTSMEQAFRTDFSRVRVHTDAQADQFNRSIRAQAFTTDRDIFFQRGAYSPQTRGGQELLAHELTHVVQQRPLGRLSRFLQRKALVNAAHMDPNGDWTPTLDGQGRVTKIVATHLALRPGHNLPGQGHNAPSVNPTGWQWLNTNNLTHQKGPPNYVRMHLLNGQLGGPGNDKENLAPGTASLNSHHLKHFEDEAQGWLTQGGEIEKYTVEVTYNAASPNLITPAAQQAWEDTVEEITGKFEFVHYVGKKRKIGTGKFEAEENPNLDTKANWLGL